MNSEKLSHAINLHDEIVLLKDILSAAENQPYLNLVFLDSKKPNFSIRDVDLVDDIFRVIKAKKENLEEVFKEL